METEPDYTAILDRIPSRWGKHVDVNPGWADLVLELNERLAMLVPDYEVHQVKEKFGGLRYYVEIDYDNCAYADFDRLIQEAESASLRICDKCGEPGSIVNTSPYWVATRCADHGPQPE